jgi:hypothetical protein
LDAGDADDIVEFLKTLTDEMRDFAYPVLP